MEINSKLNMRIVKKIQSHGANSSLYIVEDTQLNEIFMLKQIDKNKIKESSKYFEDVTNKKLKYEYVAIFICVFSAIASNVGVDTIISLSVPVLTIIYPVSVALIILSLFKNFFTSKLPYILAGYTTLVLSILTALQLPIMNQLPLAKLGFNWLLPALIVALVGQMMGAKQEIKIESFVKELD